MYPGSSKNLQKSLLWILFSTSGADLNKNNIYHTFHDCPLIFLIHCIKKVEKLTVENFDFPHLILFGLTFKEPALENSYYLKKEVGRRFVLTLTGHH